MPRTDSEQYSKVIEINSNSSIIVRGRISYIFWYNVLEADFEFSATFYLGSEDTPITLIEENISKKYNELLIPLSFDEVSPQMIEDFKKRFSEITEDVEPIVSAFKAFHIKQEDRKK